MILVLAGTGEGREKAAALEKQGCPLLASVATAYGAQTLRRSYRGEILTGSLDREDLIRIINDRGVEKIVDATHPFAVEITANARAACHRTGTGYERLEREEYSIEPTEGIIVARDTEEAAQLALEAPGVVFLTVGSNTLEHYTALLVLDRIVARILPVSSSLGKCLALGISPRNIIAMQGPFDEEMNRLLFCRYKASMVIAKESGPSGGTPEKIRAAATLKVPIVIIRRPL